MDGHAPWLSHGPSAPHGEYRRPTVHHRRPLAQMSLPTATQPLYLPRIPSSLGHGRSISSSAATHGHSLPPAHLHYSQVPGTSSRPPIDSSRISSIVQPTGAYQPTGAQPTLGPQSRHIGLVPQPLSYPSPSTQAPVGLLGSSDPRAATFNGIRVDEAVSYPAAVTTQGRLQLQPRSPFSPTASTSAVTSSSGQKHIVSAYSQSPGQHGRYNIERSQPPQASTSSHVDDTPSQTSPSSQATEAPSEVDVDRLRVRAVAETCRRILDTEEPVYIGERRSSRCNYPGCGEAYPWGTKRDHYVSCHGKSEENEVRCPIPRCEGKCVPWGTWRYHLTGHVNEAATLLGDDQLRITRKRNRDNQWADKEGKRRK